MFPMSGKLLPSMPFTISKISLAPFGSEVLLTNPPKTTGRAALIALCAPDRSTPRYFDIEVATSVVK